jgi:hypothetical protein
LEVVERRLLENVFVFDTQLHGLACPCGMGSRLIHLTNKSKGARHVRELSWRKTPRYASEKDQPIQLVNQVSAVSVHTSSTVGERKDQRVEMDLDQFSLNKP